MSIIVSNGENSTEDKSYQEYDPLYFNLESALEQIDAECNGYSGYKSNFLFDDYDGTSDHAGKYINSTVNYAHICLRSGDAATYYEGIYTNGSNSSILCSGRRSCHDTVNITSIYGSIYCTGSEACQTSNTLKAGYDNDNIENIIYCGGYVVCQDTTIMNADKLYCTGSQESCAYSLILNVKNVYILAGVHETISSTVIMSNKINGIGGQMNVYIYSDLRTQWSTNQIYCNDSDTCLIDCGTNGACSNPDSGT